MRDGLAGAGVRLAPIDGLRAVAALTVLAYHVALVLGYFGRPAGPWLAHLNVGVTLFFVLSGFLLYRPFVAARLRGDAPPSAGGFALRRVLRIVPAYWVALPVVLLVTGAAARPELFLFAQIYSERTFTAGIGQAWTLCVEMVFYAFLPVWAFARRRSTPRGELGLLAALFLAGVAWKVAVAREGVWIVSWPPGFLDHFALGMAVAAVSIVRPALRVPAPAVLVLAAVAGLVALGFFGGAPGDGPVAQALIAHEVKGLVSVALLVAALSAGGAPGRALASEPLRTVGVISYGVYLWHLNVLQELADAGWRDAVGAPLFALSALAVTLAIAALSWRLVERPSIGLARRLATRRAPAVAAQEHAAP